MIKSSKKHFFSLFFLFVILFLNLNLISSGTYSDCEIYGNCKPVSKIASVNYSLIPTVNSSDFWDDLDTPSDISYDDLSGGDVNALGYTGFFNFIRGVLGQLSIDGNPWYLGGVDLELGQELQVDGNTYLNNTYPINTLSSDLGSGANRWRWLYVQNISTEEIETYNANILNNLTIGTTYTEMYLYSDGTNAVINSTGEVRIPTDLNVSGIIKLNNGGKVWDNSTCTFISSPDGSTVQEICNA